MFLKVFMLGDQALGTVGHCFYKLLYMIYHDISMIFMYFYVKILALKP